MLSIGRPSGCPSSDQGNGIVLRPMLHHARLVRSPPRSPRTSGGTSPTGSRSQQKSQARDGHKLARAGPWGLPEADLTSPTGIDGEKVRLWSSGSQEVPVAA